MAKEVTDRQKATEFVASSAETHGARVAAAFERMFAPYLKRGEHLPDMALVLTLIARAMRDATAQLTAASDAHDRELSDDAAPREARDAAASALHDELVGIRATLENACGAPGPRALYLEGEVPHDPGALHDLARKITARIREPHFKLPKVLRKGVHVDPHAWLDDLDTHIATLDAALKVVAREVREAQATVDTKSRAKDASDLIFRRGANVISASLALVGDDTLSSQTRPSTRRPGTTVAGDTSSTEAPTAPAAPANPAKP